MTHSYGDEGLSGERTTRPSRSKCHDPVWIQTDVGTSKAPHSELISSTDRFTMGAEPIE